MKPEVKQFIESIQKDFAQAKINPSTEVVYIPFVGLIDVSNKSVFDIIRMIHDDGYQCGISNGRYNLATDLKKLLQIKDDD
jgi:hypothetical protein